MTTTETRALWRPYDDPSILTPSMARGPEHVPASELAALAAYLEALVLARAAPVHVNVAFNAAYFGYDLEQGGYVGGPLDLDCLPTLTHGATQPAMPVGTMVALSTGSAPFFGEVVYREGAHPGVMTDGSVPAWLSGAPAGAGQPRPGQAVTPERDGGAGSRAELLVVDFSAFTPGLAPTPAQLERLRQRGRHLDGSGHVRIEARYDTVADADAGEATQYQRYLLTNGIDLLLSASAPMPLSTLLTDAAGGADLDAALVGVFATVAAALAGLESVRLWGAYAFSRSTFAARLGDTGVLGGEDLGGLAGQLATSAVQSRKSRWAPPRTVTYTAIGPLLRDVHGADRNLHGTSYATLVAHANTVIGDWARRDADPDTGLHADGVHLRVDDTWQAGSIWRAERPGVVPADVDVTDPLGLGWAEAAGLLAPQSSVAAPEPAAAPEPGPEPELEPAPDPDDEGVVLSVTDSQVMWTQTLRLSHQLGRYLPVLPKLANLWDGTLSPGPVKLAVHHDGYELEPDEASQEVTLDRAGDRWTLTGVDWPLAFFPGIVLRGTWARGGRLLRVTSTLLDAPVTVDGIDIAHLYDPAVLTREGAPAGEHGQTWAARVMAKIRQMGLLDVQGCAVIEAERLLSMVCPSGDGDQVSSAARAVTELVAAGKLTRVTGGTGPGGTLLVPCPAGATPVHVLRYIPQVVVGPARRQPVPAVLRGLISSTGLSAHLLREIDVAAHIRRLPWGQQASAQKRAEYREFRARERLAGPADLPDGWTFVSPFQREI